MKPEENVYSVDRDVRQRAIYRWAVEAFGQENATRRERLRRLMEEVVELAQAESLPIAELYRIVGHVYGKPPGDPAQELGGVGVTLVAYAQAAGMSAEAEEVREWERVRAIPLAHFRARHQAKADAGIAAPPPPLEHVLPNGFVQGSAEDRATWWTCTRCEFTGPLVGEDESGRRCCMGSCGGTKSNPACTWTK